jgi:protein TonB
MKKLTLTPWTIFILVLVFVMFVLLIIWLVITPLVTERTPPPAPEAPEVVAPPPPPPKAGEISEPVRATGEIKPPKLIKKVDPEYPEAARQAKVEGIVILEATIDGDGKVQSVKVLRSVPELDQAALDAVKQWVYEPMLIDGKARGVIFTVTVRFHLK